MNEHAGLGCALSVVIVLAFTLIFHEVKPAQSPNSPVSPRLAPAVPIKSSPPLPSTRASSPLPTLVEAITPPRSPHGPSLVTSQPESDPPQFRQAPMPKSVPPGGSTAMPAPTRPLTPRGATTVVANGERLIDVALRVYGTATATDTLWRANRDQLARPNTPIEAGWLLRTP